MLNVENLSVSYGAIKAVRNISFHVAEGEIVSIIGKKAIAQILLDEGYIKNFQTINDGTQGVIRITLKYVQPGKEKVITGLRRVSKPGLRVYAGADELPTRFPAWACPWYLRGAAYTPV